MLNIPEETCRYFRRSAPCCGKLMLETEAGIGQATPDVCLTGSRKVVFPLKGLEYFVLDEADRMLDMGFIHDIKKVLKLIPARRQTLFSATMPSEIEKLADSMLTNPKKVEVTPVSSTVDTIQQSVYFCREEREEGLAAAFVEESGDRICIDFHPYQAWADKIGKDIE